MFDTSQATAVPMTVPRPITPGPRKLSTQDERGNLNSTDGPPWRDEAIIWMSRQRGTEFNSGKHGVGTQRQKAMHDSLSASWSARAQLMRMQSEPPKFDEVWKGPGNGMEENWRQGNGAPAMQGHSMLAPTHNLVPDDLSRSWSTFTQPMHMQPPPSHSGRGQPMQGLRPTSSFPAKPNTQSMMRMPPEFEEAWRGPSVGMEDGWRQHGGAAPMQGNSMPAPMQSMVPDDLSRSGSPFRQPTHVQPPPPPHSGRRQRKHGLRPTASFPAEQNAKSMKQMPEGAPPVDMPDMVVLHITRLLDMPVQEKMFGGGLKQYRVKAMDECGRLLDQTQELAGEPDDPEVDPAEEQTETIKLHNEGILQFYTRTAVIFLQVEYAGGITGNHKIGRCHIHRTDPRSKETWPYTLCDRNGESVGCGIELKVIEFPPPPAHLRPSPAALRMPPYVTYEEMVAANHAPPGASQMLPGAGHQPAREGHDPPGASHMLAGAPYMSVMPPNASYEPAGASYGPQSANYELQGAGYGPRAARAVSPGASYAPPSASYASPGASYVPPPPGASYVPPVSRNMLTGASNVLPGSGIAPQARELPCTRLAPPDITRNLAASVGPPPWMATEPPAPLHMQSRFNRRQTTPSEDWDGPPPLRRY